MSNTDGAGLPSGSRNRRSSEAILKSDPYLERPLPARSAEVTLPTVVEIVGLVERSRRVTTIAGELFTSTLRGGCWTSEVPGRDWRWVLNTVSG